MNRCPGCDYLVPDAWTACRRCGEPLALAASAAAPAPPTRAAATTFPAAPPAPIAPPPSGISPSSPIAALAAAGPPPPAPVPGAPAPLNHEPGFGAPDDALLPGAAPRDIGPDTMLPREPVIVVAPSAPRRTGVNARVVAVVVLVLACAAGGAFTLFSHGSHKAAAPEILPAQAPFAGIPTSLEAIVRIAAESARHTALSTVMDTAGPSGAPVTLSQLASAQPSYQWLAGNEVSTTNTMISVESVAGADQIAVSGTSREVCAFGRWSPAAGATYVTVANAPSCDAEAAPATGWSTLAGGSAQDLPDANGG